MSSQSLTHKTSENLFFQTMEPLIFKASEEFDEIKREKRKKEMEREQQEAEIKKQLLNNLIDIMKNVKIRVPDINHINLAKIDKKKLESEFEESAVCLSKILEDVSDLRKAIIDMNALKNSLFSVLHKKFKFHHRLSLNVNEVKIYISSDDLFNKMDSQIKKVETQIEKSKEFASLLQSKIGFIRDITKLKTQELFGESRG